MLIYGDSAVPKPRKQLLNCFGCSHQAELLTPVTGEKIIYVCDDCEKKYGKLPLEEMPRRSFREI